MNSWKDQPRDPNSTEKHPYYIAQSVIRCSKLWLSAIQKRFTSMFNSLCMVRKRSECCKLERFPLKRNCQKRTVWMFPPPSHLLPSWTKMNRVSTVPDLAWMLWRQRGVNCGLCPPRVRYGVVQRHTQAKNSGTTEDLTGCALGTTEEHRSKNNEIVLRSSETSHGHHSGRSG